MRIGACVVRVLCMHCIIREDPGRGHREKQTFNRRFNLKNRGLEEY